METFSNFQKTFVKICYKFGGQNPYCPSLLDTPLLTGCSVRCLSTHQLAPTIYDEVTMMAAPMLNGNRGRDNRLTRRVPLIIIILRPPTVWAGH